MGQRVNIQYSVEMEELESEVNRLASSAFNDLTAAQIVSDAILSNLFSLQTLESIEQIRALILKVDTRLLDVTNIVAGYMNFKTQQDSAKAEGPPTVSHDHLDDLKDKLATFKQNLDASDIVNENPT